MRSKKHDLPFGGTWKRLFATIYSTITRTSYQLLSHITAKIDTSGRQSIDKKSFVGRFEQFAKWTKTVERRGGHSRPRRYETQLPRTICDVRAFVQPDFTAAGVGLQFARRVNLILEQFLIVSLDCQLQFGMRLIELVGCRKLAENDGSSRGQRWHTAMIEFDNSFDKFDFNSNDTGSCVES